MTRRCERCGKVMILGEDHEMQRFCYECRTLNIREQAARSRQKRRDAGIVSPKKKKPSDGTGNAPKQSIVSARCRGCRHDEQLFYANVKHMCAYILHTGHRRPCPAGDGCTVREQKQKKKKDG